MQAVEVRHCTSSKCTRQDDDLMVSCDKCKRWWHYDCHSFDPDKYDTLTPWFCEEDDCVFQEDSTSQDVSHRESLAALAKEDDVVQNVDIIIEAAAVAQAAVAQRDKELVELRAELAETKFKLSKASSALPSGSKPLKPSVNATSSTKLEIIKKIQANHKALLSKETKTSSALPSGSKPLKPSVNATSSTKLEIIKKIQANHKALLSSTLKQNIDQNQSSPFRDIPPKDSGARDSCFRDQDMATLLTILNRNNVQELPSFSGENKREWPYFEEVYKSTTIEGRYSDKENVARLRKALKGEAYHMVSDRLKYSSDADAIMDSLRTMFGRSDVLVHDLTAELLNLPKLSSKCDPKLRIWAVKINGFVADLKSINKEEDLTNGYVLTCLASRLGASLYQEWQKRKSGLLNVSIQQFAEFLTEKVIDLPPDLLKVGSEQKKAVNKTSRVLLHQPASVSTNDLCCKCSKKKHVLSECDEFLALTPIERQAFAQEKSICFTCLNPSRHQWKVCAKKRSCGIEGCSRRHHPLLHTSANTSSTELNSLAVPFVPQPHIHSSHVGFDVSILFKIVPIRIYGNGDLFVDTYAFLDDGSSLSMVDEELFHELGLNGQSKKLTLQWTKGVSRVEDCKKTTFSVSGIQTRKRYVLQNVYTIKNLGLASQSIDVTHLKSLYPHLRGLPLVDLVDARPKILLGLDQAKFLLGRGQRHGKDDEPHALKTLLGWIVYGRSAPSMALSCLEPASKPSMRVMFHEAIREEADLHELVRHHFTTEEFGVMAPKGEFVSREVSRSIDIMEQSLKQVGTQYEIGLLWTSDDVKLPDSFGMAFKRLISLEKSLKKNPRLMEWQNNYFRELLTKGYARIASQEELKKDWPRVWYAPTFIIVNPNKSPPKPRCVADVAAKVNGVSLNTYLSKGPDNLVPLHAGLFKFREREVAVNGDVREMFHRIRIKAEDQQCQRILWRDGDTTRQPTVYIMEVMMFGPRCSPSCAQYVKNVHANRFKAECPEAVDGLTKRTYVDDYFNSHNSMEEAVKVTKDALPDAGG
ncbi:uncharacterized protein LOC129914930 [Episyrphus balteatus]|uniref:uncharacterized protein LOC129914930 n=1 Tax=Episyrphus balteatus TaxID=286459 RepID=UPI0024865CE7|nr:uncharacterized protein LOC129914930 [Episyrphus balteatus]